MPNVATSVRIAADTNCILSQLTAKLGKSKAQVIETALKELEEGIFWTEVGDAFDRMAADPDEVAYRGSRSHLRSPVGTPHRPPDHLSLIARRNHHRH